MSRTRVPHLVGNDAESWLRSRVDEWTTRGIISPDQAERMLAGHPAERAGLRRGRGPSAAVEAAGYLGGSLVVVATILIAAQYWSDLSTIVRTGSVGAAALALLVAGSLVSGHGQQVGDRLVAVLWLASTAATAGFLALLADTALDRHVAPVAAAGSAIYVATLWASRRFFVLQIATMVALMVTAATTIDDLSTTDSLTGFGIWLVAAAWLLLGWIGQLGPPRAVTTLGAAGMVVGAITTLPTAEGFVLALGTVAAVAGLGVLRREPLLLGVAALGSLEVLPAVVVEWFPDSSLAPFVLLSVGVLMVGAAVWAARGRRLPSH